MVNEQWPMVSGQWSMISGASTTDDQPWALTHGTDPSLPSALSLLLSSPSPALGSCRTVGRTIALTRWPRPDLLCALVPNLDRTSPIHAAHAPMHVHAHDLCMCTLVADTCA